jgi:GT2 family glycosyltransferase
MNPESPQLAIITGVYNNYALLDDLFLSLSKQRQLNFRVFLVDVSEKPQPIAPQPWLTILQSNNNGYSHLVNCGLKKAIESGLSKFSVINSDVILPPDFSEKVWTSLNQHPASLIGGKIYYAPGFEYHQYPKDELGRVLWYAGGEVDWKNIYTKHLGVDLVDQGQFEQFSQTRFITGCLINFDQTVIDKIGFWSEEYFLYYEDADYCERAKRASIQLFYDPQIYLYHKNAQSTGGAGSKLHEKHQRLNRLRFGLKYGPIRTKIHLLINYFREAFWLNK